MSEGEKGKVGLVAAIDAAGTGEAPAAAAGEQLALLPLSERGGEPPADLADMEPARRAPGRPAGARNKRTEAWVGYLLSRYRSPLVGLAEIYSRPVAELARELGFASLTPEIALKLVTAQIEAMKALAPYVHQRQPLAVQIDERRTVRLVVEEYDGKAADTGDGDALSILEGIVIDIEENQ